MKKISLLGATGSIGTQTLDVIRLHPESFQLAAMSIGKNLDLGLKIIEEFQPKLVAVLTKENGTYLQQQVSGNIKIVYGMEGLIEVAAYYESHVLVNAVLGSVGLAPTLAAIKEKKNIAIANKETLVTAGHLIMEQAQKYNVSILPVDSEHSAIFQCLQGENPKELARIILTASGGSFRDKTRSELVHVTKEDALKHPNWSMGAKITIDSATMMNKGLEVIEAYWLFGLPYEKIDVILHKESVIHSMIEMVDTSVIAHLGTPDMKIPIQYALTYPSRLELKETKRLNLIEMGTLHFSEANFERYRCLKYAYEAGKTGGTLPTVLNAANEEAVAAFLNDFIGFLEIENLIEKAMDRHQLVQFPSLEEISEIDVETRRYVQSLIK
ncbi:1-deoxy-D-xylulose-5-phosphate reductoisomerase [Bacillus taeanensis]|uniref:1-deoxy-D-xylulose 5-phosphate reductoisomerase n=1 Tax=Bacillus taeanensis TaxID=273032 RepID=A0A366XWT3_9BACI|nr:1-deoxy-D-xylulose-5-phosphate reductoisomerase [Bacillus taeanensis]RBW70018.1 1-deoxy-D-xylulose-5-phosphate reductoisomerase [Bacillus taeanensis]